MVLAWGGRSLTLFRITDDGHIDAFQRERFHNDWIVYGHLAGESFFILTAHNIVFEIGIDAVIQHVYENPEENSILYSGSISIANGRALVAAGTVLNGVIIWDMKTGKTLRNFTQHEGSIFGVRFSADNRYLLSCSDDRCIKLWDLESGEGVATGWGHLARIWDIKFYKYQTDRNISEAFVVSASEDCTARVWKIENGQLVTVRVMEGHLGRNTWCCAIHPDDKVLATGGSDGRVRLWDLEEKEAIDASRQLLSVESATTTPDKKEVFKSFSIVGDAIFLTTSTGKIYSFSNNKYTEIDISSYSAKDTYLVVKGWESISTAAVAYRDGTCLIVSPSTTIARVQNPLAAKLTDIHTWTFGGKFYLLAQSQNPNDPYVLTVFDSAFGVESQIQLQQPSAFLPISVEMINKNILFLGSRFGAVAYYDISKSTAPQACWRHIFSSDGITSMIFHADTETLYLTSRGGYFGVAQVTSGESGLLDWDLVSSNKLQRGSIEGSLFTPSRKKIFWGFRNDLFFIWNETDQCEVSSERCGGPHRNWDVCIASETSYTFLYSKISQVMLVQSLAADRMKFSKTLLQDGSHGREIRAIAFWPGKLQNSSAVRVVATASEDTCINIALLDTATGQLTTKCILPKHISGIQALKWSQDGEYLYSSGGREEFFVWRVKIREGSSAHVSVDVFAIPVAVLPPSTDVADLRIMDFAAVPYGPQHDLIVTVYSDSAIRVWVYERSRHMPLPSPADETAGGFHLLASGKYRSCCLLNCDVIVHGSRALLVLSSTDGHVAGWDLSDILNVEGSRLVFAEPPAAPFSLGTWLFRLQTHQSSIKDSVICGPFESEGATYYHHVGGGDDNSLCVSRITFTETSIGADKVCSVASAHSSTVTGLALVHTKGASETAGETVASHLRFVSVGVDQNVRLWQLSPRENGGGRQQLVLQDSVYTTIADTGCVAIDERNAVVVGGLGLSYWRL